MELIDITTERTTAATDVILALLAAAAALAVHREGRSTDHRRGRIWTSAFVLVAVASALGAVAHGLRMNERTNFLIWQPLNLALGLTIAMFLIGVIYDWTRGSPPRAVAPILVGVGVVFYAVTLRVPGTFIVFVLYEAVAMLLALAAYVVMAVRGRLAGAWLMAAGILVTIIAAAVQATEAVEVRILWEFDHNGIFHIIQMIGVVLLLLGLRPAFSTHHTFQETTG
jgi:hypothetical protein